MDAHTHTHAREPAAAAVAAAALDQLGTMTARSRVRACDAIICDGGGRSGMASAPVTLHDAIRCSHAALRVFFVRVRLGRKLIALQLFSDYSQIVAIYTINTCIRIDR